MPSPEEIIAVLDFLDDPEAHAPPEIAARAERVRTNAVERRLFNAEQRREAERITREQEAAADRVAALERRATYDPSTEAHYDELPSAIADFLGLERLATALRPHDEVIRDPITGKTGLRPRLSASPEGVLAGSTGNFAPWVSARAREALGEDPRIVAEDEAASTERFQQAGESPGGGGMLGAVLAGLPQTAIPLVRAGGVVRGLARGAQIGEMAAAQSAATEASFDDNPLASFEERFRDRALPAAALGIAAEAIPGVISTGRKALSAVGEFANDAWARAYERALGNSGTQQAEFRGMGEAVGAVERFAAEHTPEETARFIRQGAAAQGLGAHARDVEGVLTEWGMGPTTPADRMIRAADAEAERIAAQRAPLGAGPGMGVNRDQYLDALMDDAASAATRPNDLAARDVSDAVVNLGGRIERDASEVIPFGSARTMRGQMQNTIESFQSDPSSLAQRDIRDAAATSASRLMNQHIDQGLLEQAGPEAMNLEQHLRRRAQIVSADPEASIQASAYRRAEQAPAHSAAVNIAAMQPVRGIAQLAVRHGNAAAASIWSTLADLGYGELAGPGAQTMGAVTGAIEGTAPALRLAAPGIGRPRPDEASLDARATAPETPPPDPIDQAEAEAEAAWSDDDIDAAEAAAEQRFLQAQQPQVTP